MSLIIEDGTRPLGANSYVTVDEFIAFLAARNQAVEAGTEEGLLLDAMAYLEQYSGDTTPAYKGWKFTSEQGLQWPRTGVVIDEFRVTDTTIPINLKNAQMQLGLEAISYDLMPSSDGYAVASEKVDVIEVEYATGGRLSGSTLPATPNFPRVQALLKPLFRNTGMRLRSVRI